jgi:hypothetical protein
MKPKPGSGHALELTFDGGSYYGHLTHPPSGCIPQSFCSECYKSLSGDDACADACACTPTSPSNCWLDRWAEDLTEFVSGKIIFPVSAIWDHDCPLIEIDGAVETVMA